MSLARLSSLLNRVLMVVGGAALILLVLLATGNVAMRIVRVPLGGAYEVVSFLGALVIASALGHTQREKDHIVVDILSGRFPAPLKRVLDAASAAVSAALFSIVAWRLFAWGRMIRQTGELSETLRIPFHPFVFCVSAGFAALALALLIDLFAALFEEGRP